MQTVRLSDDIRMKRFISHNHVVEYGNGDNKSNYDYILDDKDDKEKED